MQMRRRCTSDKTYAALASRRTEIRLTGGGRFSVGLHFCRLHNDLYVFYWAAEVYRNPPDPVAGGKSNRKRKRQR